MRILLAAKHAPHGSRPIGGVQSWCRTVCRELEQRGFDVETWGVDQSPPSGNFDLGIIANVGDTRRVVGQCKRVVVISHGIITAENPYQHDLRLVPVVFTSEEIRDHWNGVGFIVRQPIDLGFWTPKENKQIYLTRFSYRSGLKFIPGIARNMGLKYAHVRNLSSRGARDVIRKSACVLATGRAALEAMACGVPVVICDHRSSYQAPLIDLDITGAAKRNYSGRGGETPTPELVRGAIELSIRRGSMRRHVEENHGVAAITDQLLDIARKRRRAA